MLRLTLTMDLGLKARESRGLIILNTTTYYTAVGQPNTVVWVHRQFTQDQIPTGVEDYSLGQESNLHTTVFS